MSTSHYNPHNRASLLAGLRTGGVRSASVPHSATPAGSFNAAPFPQPLPTFAFPDDDEGDQISEMPQSHRYNNRNFSMTAAVDGPNNRFASQQAAPRGMNPLSVPFNPPQVMNNQLQLQMMQLEMMRLQALQAQQLQTEILAQQIQQATIQARERRTSLGFNPPATAGPVTNSFNVGPATNGSMRRPSQADFLRAQLGVGTPSTDHVPMTAAIGGRFATRSTSLNVHPSIQIDQPATPNPGTTIISGGTSLGNSSPNSIPAPAPAVATPSKSDTASSWRRGGNNNSVLTPNRGSASKLGQRSSPPPGETSPSTHLGIKFRPQPLRFNAAVSQPLPTVAIDTTDDETDETHSSGSSVKSIASKSSPTTPRSTSSHEMPLSPREEASKKLFEGLGISRPVSATPSDQGQNQQQAFAIPIISTTPPAHGHRLISQPTRQPRGPPSGADELGPKNFATRIRRKAIGGLGMLMGARDRREAVEAF